MKFYPIGRRIVKGFLPVSSLHTLYYECYGNPKGTPVITFHGGPGSGLSNKSNKLFHPKKWFIVRFDQRGCGKSTPFGEFSENTTMHLVEDTKQLMNHLNIKRAMLYGSSWGSTLALAFALKYPRKVTALILSGIFLGTREELQYMFSGAQQFFPEVLEEVLKSLNSPPKKAIANFHSKVFSKNQKIAIKFASILSDVESTLGDFKHKAKNPLPEMKYFLHYAIHNYFLPPGYILRHAKRLKFKPAAIVHGRNDMLCRPIGAYFLHKELKKSSLSIVPKTSHGSSKFSQSALLKEIHTMANILRN
jgi:proline iminopeptidase